MTTSSPVTYTMDGNIAVIAMDDGKANALSEPMIAALRQALERAENEAGAAVLVGRADRFCAGFDLKVMMSGPGPAIALLGHGSELLMRLYGAKLPLVIAVTGHALAGGALVVLTGDVRIGAAGAFRIGLNEVSIGMPLPLLGMELARARLRPTELGPATLQSKIYAPEGAMRAGYLDEVVPADQVLPRALEEARRLASLPKAAYVGTKKRQRGATIAFITSNLESDGADLLGG
jgi:enoyl-CoA hydratase